MKFNPISLVEEKEVSLPSRGAWIEIGRLLGDLGKDWSLPSRGAWIEIYKTDTLFQSQPRRSPRGERGLKSQELRAIIRDLCRSPRGERGLKYI